MRRIINWLREVEWIAVVAIGLLVLAVVLVLFGQVFPAIGIAGAGIGFAVLSLRY